MSTFDLDITCPDCGPAPLVMIRGGDLAAWQQLVARRGLRSIECPSCGSTYEPTNSGDTISQVETSIPRITSVSPATGPAAGGTPITLTGSHLDVGTLVVTIGNTVHTPRDITETTAVVDTPPGAANKPVGITVANEHGSCPEGRIYPGFTYT